ncbi:MAG: hydantoin racemase [Candidatus Rokubacteria bacterium]|nr:hydantoin racemase [Candidatus Rokubacteria bacterium]
MTRHIEFINPFGTPIYDQLIQETLLPYAGADTKVEVTHLTGCPANIDYYYPKHLMEIAIFDRVIEAEKRGCDAVIIGCCYDPGVLVARELVDVPVVGPLEASLAIGRYFGHDFTVLTDHHKAVPYLRDMVRLYGYEPSCRAVRCINWWVTDMVKDPAAVAGETVRIATEAMKEDESEVVILGCTIIAGCLEQRVLAGEHRDVPIINPNLAALKMAELLADLKKMGKYNISRRGYYEKQTQHVSQATEFEEVRRRYRLVDLDSQPRPAKS